MTDNYQPIEFHIEPSFFPFVFYLASCLLHLNTCEPGSINVADVAFILFQLIDIIDGLLFGHFSLFGDHIV